MQRFNPESVKDRQKIYFRIYNIIMENGLQHNFNIIKNHYALISLFYLFINKINIALFTNTNSVMCFVWESY